MKLKYLFPVMLLVLATFWYFWMWPPIYAKLSGTPTVMAGGALMQPNSTTCAATSLTWALFELNGRYPSTTNGSMVETFYELDKGIGEGEYEPSIDTVVSGITHYFDERGMRTETTIYFWSSNEENWTYFLMNGEEWTLFNNTNSAITINGQKVEVKPTVDLVSSIASEKSRGSAVVLAIDYKGTQYGHMVAVSDINESQLTVMEPTHGAFVKVEIKQDSITLYDRNGEKGREGTLISAIAINPVG